MGPLLHRKLCDWTFTHSNSVPQMYGVGGQLIEGIKASYRKANACIKVDGELSDSFAIRMGVRQGCVMSPWLSNIFMDGCMRGKKAKVVEISVVSISKCA